MFVNSDVNFECTRLKIHIDEYGHIIHTHTHTHAYVHVCMYVVYLHASAVIREQFQVLLFCGSLVTFKSVYATASVCMGECMCVCQCMCMYV